MVAPVLSFLEIYHENMFEFIKGILFVYWHNTMNYIFTPIYIFLYLLMCIGWIIPLFLGEREIDHDESSFYYMPVFDL